MLLSADAVIRAAIANGEFEDLPGRGQPLPSDDLSMVPHEHRLAFRVLRNAGVVPPEVMALNELSLLRDTIARTEDPKIKDQLLAKFYAMESRVKMRLDQFRRA